MTRLDRTLLAWLIEAKWNYVEHKCIHPVHYYLHQTKHHYRRNRGKTTRSS